MIKGALLGLHISQSLSPEFYSQRKEIQYELWDCHSRAFPSLNRCSQELSFLNLTSPFKRRFLYHPNIKHDHSVLKSGSMNLLVFLRDQVLSYNTDYLAMAELLARWKNSNMEVLGEGAMADIVFSLSETFNICLNQRAPHLILDARSKESQFPKLKAGTDLLYWDLNYNRESQFKHLNPDIAYFDGQTLLALQGKKNLEILDLLFFS